MKIQNFKNGAHTVFEKLESGYYLVKVVTPSGNVHDKVRCDDYRDALDYLKSFKAIAKNL